MSVEVKSIGIVAVTHNWYATPRSLNDKLTLLIELHQDKHIRSHFQYKNCDLHSLRSTN